MYPMKKLTRMRLNSTVIKTELKSQQIQVDGIFCIFIWTIKRNRVTGPSIYRKTNEA